MAKAKTLQKTNLHGTEVVGASPTFGFSKRRHLNAQTLLLYPETGSCLVVSLAQLTDPACDETQSKHCISLSNCTNIIDVFASSSASSKLKAIFKKRRIMPLPEF